MWISELNWILNFDIFFFRLFKFFEQMALLTANTIAKLRLLSNRSSINKFTLHLIKKSDPDAQQRCTSTTSSNKGSSVSISELNQAGLPNKTKLDLSFEDSETAFKAKSNSDLLRGYLVFKLCGINYLIENQKMVKIKAIFF